jgi:hypothetical protein
MVDGSHPGRSWNSRYSVGVSREICASRIAAVLPSTVDNLVGRVHS